MAFLAGPWAPGEPGGLVLRAAACVLGTVDPQLPGTIPRGGGVRRGGFGGGDSTVSVFGGFPDLRYPTSLGVVAAGLQGCDLVQLERLAALQHFLEVGQMLERRVSTFNSRIIAYAWHSITTGSGA